MKNKSLIISRSFYTRPTLEVARDLLGMTFVFDHPLGEISARIVEVEAYNGKDDPACHASRGKTKRNEVMFGVGGTSYIYFIYGMYYCFNVVTESEGFPAAVLIRGAEPLSGLSIMQGTSPRGQKLDRLLSGPGKLCRGMGLNIEQNGLDLTRKGLYLRYGKSPSRVTETTRIGIKLGKELVYRFYDTDSSSVSIR